MNINGRLKNGVELYTCLNPNLRGFCLSVWIRQGSLHEPKEYHGLAHFLEHAIFRSISERMSHQLYPTLTRYNLCFDATTSEGLVRFEISGPSENIEVALEILLMVLIPPELCLEAMDMERRRIHAEILEDAEEETADFFAHSRVWRGTPMARTIVGTKSSVNRIGFEAVKAEHGRWFRRGNFFFCATGRVPDLAGLAARLEDLAVKDEASPEDRAVPAPEDFFQRNAAIFVEERDYSWLRFCFDVNMAHHSTWEQTLLCEWLFGNFGALYLALSENTGLVYGVDDYFERYDCLGNLCFGFEVDSRFRLQAIEATVKRLNEAKHEAEGILTEVRRAYIWELEQKYDQVCNMNAEWGRANGLDCGGFDSLASLEAAYRRIQPENLRQFAREIFVPDNLTLFLRGKKRGIHEDAIREKLLGLG